MDHINIMPQPVDTFMWSKAREKAKRPVLGVGKLARELLLEHRDWTHAEIAAEVKRQLGSNTSPSCARWYAVKMRKEGLEVSRIRVKERMA